MVAAAALLVGTRAAAQEKPGKDAALAATDTQDKAAILEIVENPTPKATQ
jgi:hypothetical protein